MSKVIIELNYDVANKFLNGYYNPIIEKLKKLVSPEEYVSPLDDLPIPFDKFTISIPTTVFLTEEQVYEDTMRNTRERKGAELNSKEIKLITKLAKDYVNNDLRVNVDIEEDVAKVKLNHVQQSKPIFVFNFGIIEPKIEVEYNDFTTNEGAFAGKLIHLILNTLEYINKPKEEVVITEKREVKKSKNGKKNKKNRGKTYIYKKVYKILDVKPNEEKRKYTRIAESWRVRGHWRKYKSGKKVWINGYSKGKGRDTQDKKEYRITRIDK